MSSRSAHLPTKIRPIPFRQLIHCAQSLVYCIFTECNAELYAPAVRQVTDACEEGRWNDTIHTLLQDSGSSTSPAANKTLAKLDVDLEPESADHGDAADDTTGPHLLDRRPRSPSSPAKDQAGDKSPRNDEPVLADCPPIQNMDGSGCHVVSNRTGLATITLTVTKYVAFDLPGGSYSEMDNIGSNATGPEHIGKYEGSNPPTPARMVDNDARTVPMAPTPPMTSVHPTYGTSTARSFAAKVVANIPGPPATSFITVTVPIVPVQQGGYTVQPEGYTPTVTSNCESLEDGSGTGGTPGTVPTGGPSGGPADVSGVVPPISYSYTTAIPLQVTASRGCRSLAFSILPSVVVTQAIVVFFGLSLAP